MELRTTWHILLRRKWIPITLFLLTLLLTLVTQKPWQSPPPTYAMSLSFSVGMQPQAAPTAYNYDGYYTALASEYLIDDFAEIVKGSEFAARVTQHLADKGISIAPGVIQGSTQTGTLHRILQITLYSVDAAQLADIADAVSTTLTDDASLFMPRLLAGQGAVYLINRGNVVAIGPSLRQRLDFPLRLVLALVAGIGLAFLAEYLDDRVRTSADLEALGLPTMGEIPRR